MKLSSPAEDEKTDASPTGSDKSAGTSTSPTSVLPDGAPAARLCHMVQRPDYDGYGFKLLALKQRSLPYVLAVEPGSPAEDAGLRPNDIIVEVNGKSLRGAVHQDVVQRIKAIPHEARLLVVDCDTAAWYEEHGIEVHGDLPNIIRISSVNATRNRAARARKKSSGSDLSSGSLKPAELAGGLRLCYLRTWPSFDGYGFNVVAGKEGWKYFIANVVPGSPGELGGLREEDRLIEVNGMPVEGKTHHEVMTRIKQEPHQVDLLVIDEETDEAFAIRKQKPSGQADGVLRRWTPARPPRMTIGASRQQATKASLDRGAVPNVAERGMTASRERHHYVAEDGTLIEYRQPAVLARSDQVPIFTAPGGARPSVRSGSSSYASMSISSSGTMTPLDPTEGLRLCHLVKWPSFEGYGFAVTPDRWRRGHFIAHVDNGSPAHLGGLRKKDRIVEVNGYDVEGESYRDVVNRIKKDPTKVDLLVIDRDTDADFTRRKQTPSSLADTVVHRWTPEERPRLPPVATKPQDTSKSPVGSEPLFVVVPGNASSTPNRAPNGQQAGAPAAATSVPCSYKTEGQRHKFEPQDRTLPSEVRPSHEGGVPFQCVSKDYGTFQNQAETLASRKSEPPDRAKQSSVLDTVVPSERAPIVPLSEFPTSTFFVSSDLNDSGWLTPDSQTKNAEEYFSRSQERPSAPFTPTHSASPSPFDSPPCRSPKNGHSTASPSGHTAHPASNNDSPRRLAVPVSLQAPYVAPGQVFRDDQPTTYAPGYSDFFTMYSGYASSEPLSRATEAPVLPEDSEQQGGADSPNPAYDESTDAS